jgi:hypothetical protein
MIIYSSLLKHAISNYISVKYYLYVHCEADRKTDSVRFLLKPSALSPAQEVSNQFTNIIFNLYLLVYLASPSR